MSQTENIFNINGKLVLVTGGFGLLGEEIVTHFLKEGATVVVLDCVDDAEKAARFSEISNEFSYINCDITSAESVARAMNQIVEEQGKVDVLINNAYPRNENYGKKFEDVALSDWQDNVSQHLGGYFNVTQQVVPIMKKQKSGTIVFMASIYGMVGPQFSVYEGTDMTMPPEYAAIKGGLVNFTRYLSTNLAPYNITVNSVSPGGIYNKQDNKFVARYEERVPLGRMGKAKDILGAIHFLVSPAADYVTGQNIAVDGGWTAW